VTKVLDLPGSGLNYSAAVLNDPSSKLPQRASITQAELEKEMAGLGRARLDRIIAANETGGRANNNPYASAIFKRFVRDLSKIIDNELKTPTPGRNNAYVTLLKGMDPLVVAYLAVRNVLNSMMGNTVGRKRGDQNAPMQARSVGAIVGKAVHNEMILTYASDESPALFYSLANDLGRRFSKSERHRMNVFKTSLKKKGIVFPEWGARGVQQVGDYLVNRLVGLGMVETSKPVKVGSRGIVRTEASIVMTDRCIGIMASIKDYVLDHAAYYVPCVEPPKDWISIDDGGWHTEEMRKLQPFAVKSSAVSEFETANMAKTFEAMNALQRTAWAINKRVLEAVEGVRRFRDTGEIVSDATLEKSKPARPEWWGDEDVKDLPADQQLVARQWKARKRDWETEKRRAFNRLGRCTNAIAVARKYSDFPAIYFVYQADFRGRMYPQTTGVSPQGSDMQKALIHFASGKPIDTPDAFRWFCIHGANKYGYDKASLDARAKWHEDKHDQIMRIAGSPVDFIDEWSGDKVKCPLQFLAWCFEYKAYHDSPDTFVSRLPIAMDGSCNGLQNFSAMLRDEIGGKATNLVPLPLPQDIYGLVANRLAELLERAHHRTVPENDDTSEVQAKIAQSMTWNRHLDAWRKHGMNRKLVKQCVMTRPYGSKQFAWGSFIVEYLREVNAPEFDQADYTAAGRMLSAFAWTAVNDVIVKSNEAMEWLQKSAKQIIEGGADAIRWTTPTGFPVAQFYHKPHEETVRTLLNGNARLKLRSETDEASSREHVNGIAPNFIHSYDASHMALVAIAASREGMSLAMIHDDFGCHAADAGRFSRIVRQEFVGMYEQCDPLASFAEQYGTTEPPPTRGTLDLGGVLESDYFFS